MKIDGRCHCGYISYEAEIDSEKIVICHCIDCQALGGAPFRTIAFTREGTFKLLAGTPKIYIKTAESGRQRAVAFCPECGTGIYGSSAEEQPKVYGVRVGTIRQRNELRPKLQIWARSAQPWLGELGAIKKVETQSS